MNRTVYLKDWLNTKISFIDATDLLYILRLKGWKPEQGDVLKLPDGTEVVKERHVPGSGDVNLELVRRPRRRDMAELDYASFVGAAFEQIFQNMLETGCTLCCRDLENPSAPPFHISFKSCQTRMLPVKLHVSGVRTANYFIPVSKTCDSRDSILQPDLVFQVTTADSHEVLGKGLENCLRLLPLRDTYKIYFVVPVHRFDSFKKQHVTYMWGDELKVYRGRVISVKQYVLKLDLV